MRSILDAVRQAARKKVLFLPQAIKQLARPAIMISTGEVDHVVAEVCSPKDEYLAIITTYVPDGSQWPPDVQRRMPAKVVAPRRV